MKRSLLFVLSVMLLLGFSAVLSSCDMDLPDDLGDLMTEESTADTEENLDGADEDEGEFLLIGEELYYCDPVTGTPIENAVVDGYTLGANGRLEQSGFVKIGENTYHLSNTYRVSFDQQIIESSIYDFGADGKMVTDGDYAADGKLIANELFVTVNGDVYYLVNNVIVYNQLVIEGSVYNFGDDGKMVTGGEYTDDGKLIANESFVTVNGDVYYIINNVVVYNQFVIEGFVYDFGSDGKMVTGQKGEYTYGEDGKLIGDELFVTVNGDVYYVVNNVIVYNQFIIDGAVYDFGSDGKMTVGTKGELTYGADGKLIGNEIFVEINGSQYYIINNVIAYNHVVIDGYIYNFGDDGQKVIGERYGYIYDSEGRLQADSIFLHVDGDMYYIVNNTVVYNQIIIDGFVYDFGSDGKMVIGGKDGYFYGSDGKMQADQAFLTVNGDVYYIVNNVIVYNQIIIDGSVYNFGDDGKMITWGDYGPDGKMIANETFLTINGDVYYIINNVIVYNQIVIGESVYNFGDDGKMVTGGDYGADGKLIANEIFVEINGDVYYIINNVIVYNQIIIDGAIYNFGFDGKMITGGDYGADGKLIGDEIFVEINGDVYYVINNVIVYNQIVINGYVYNFGNDGKMVTGGDYDTDGKLIASEIFVEINGDVYYIINNVIVYNQIIIGGTVYNFGEDGKMMTGGDYTEDGEYIANNVFVNLDGKTYYMINNEIAYRNQYVVIDQRVYRFDENGARLENTEFEGNLFGAEGYLKAENLRMIIGGVIYMIVDDIATPYDVAYFEVSGSVTESDHDLIASNNNVLSGVLCEVYLDDGTLYATDTTDADGLFDFGTLPQMELTFKFTLSGYITVEYTATPAENSALPIVMDQEASNNLSGKVVIADSDNTLNNNYALSGAKVTLTRTTSTNALYFETTTDSNGNYTFSGLTAGVYLLTIEKDGYISVSQYVQVRYNMTNVQNVAVEVITAPDEGVEVVGSASGTVKDARTGNPVAGLTVYVYAGINNYTGEPLCVVVTDSNGQYLLENLAPGNYTAYVVDERELSNEDERYGSYPISVKVLPNTTVGNQNATISNSVNINVDGMRIVLTWGSTPGDLDSHLTFGGSHVYYGNKVVGDASLDVDDTSAYGPETITISSMGDYTYQYYIYNYSRSGTMMGAQACVNVYFGGSSEPAYTFYPPSGSGYYWNVFTYNAMTGEFTVVNTVN